MRRLLFATAVMLVSGLVGGCASSPWAPPQAAPPPPPPKVNPQAATPEAMQEVMAELQQLGEVDPAAREKLMADLKQTDPKLWPQVVQQFKAAVAYRRRQTERELAANGQPRMEAPVNGVVATGYSAPSGPAAQMTATTAPTAAVPLPPPQVISPPVAAQPPTSPANTAGPTAPQVNAPLVGTTPAVKPVAEPSTGGVTATIEQKPAAANSPGPAVEAKPVEKAKADWRESLAGAIQTLEAETQKTPDSQDAVLRQSQLRMLCLAAGRREDALKPLTAGTPIERDYWAKQVYGLDTWLDKTRNPDLPRRAAETKRILEESASRLAETAPLAVRNLAFCTDIQSYGCYKKFKADEFKPDQELLLYAEVENFMSEADAKGFHTALRSSYQIFDSRGQRVEDHEFTVTEEHCQNPRRDFFIGYQLRLPKRIYPGKHTLQLTIEDLKSRKVGQSSLDLVVREAAK